MAASSHQAPGAPGISPRWTSSAKSGIGTALTGRSRVWFTLSHGIVNEVYYPRIDAACIRDFGLLVTAEGGFFSEEKRDCSHAVEPFEAGVPAYRLMNTCRNGRYRIGKELLTDPDRDVLLQRIRFEALQGLREQYHLYALLAPHLADGGMHNTAWLGEFKGYQVLYAQRRAVALALVCSQPWIARSAGYVGVSDGWQDLARHGRMLWNYERAENGNVALCGDIALEGADEIVLALGFASSPAEAAHRAIASLQDGFDRAASSYVERWRTWQQRLRPLGRRAQREGYDAYRVSTSVLRAHDPANFPGAIIASLSIPWGASRGDADLGGYHLVWVRDLVEAASALLACGAIDDVRRVLSYLQTTQEADGHWPQNMWLDGVPYWNGTQMDECALPILLVDLLRRTAGSAAADVRRFWPMVRRAATYIVQNGPATQQDRWEEDAGYAPFTLGAEIAALLAAADLADEQAQLHLAVYWRETADYWNGNVESWTYVTGTPLANRLGIEGYYVRITANDSTAAPSPLAGMVHIRNRPETQSSRPATEVISTDALALVRFGLRSAHDPRIVNTLKTIDSLLKADLPSGPAWYRYNDDGYGEHEDGSPFDGTGVGRPWPLLTGERAHYAIAAGDIAEAERLLDAFEATASDGGLLPEQVWDTRSIEEKELIRGKPAGSAMPLVWAHAEHVKLLRSLSEQCVFDMPPQPVQRYQIARIGSSLCVWRFTCRRRFMHAGNILRIETTAAAIVHWSADGWKTTEDRPTRDSGSGMHIADLPAGSYAAGTQILFTFHWPGDDRWEGIDYQVTINP
jgi:glucoamylase